MRAAKVTTARFESDACRPGRLPSLASVALDIRACLFPDILDLAATTPPATQRPGRVTATPTQRHHSAQQVTNPASSASATAGRFK